MLRNSVQAQKNIKPVRKKPLIITPRDEQILSAILQYRALTVEQVTRLFYKPGSLTYVRTILKELVDHKYLTRIHFPTVSIGASPFVYSLGSRGISYFSARDLSMPGYKPVEAGNYYFLLHLLQLNDFAIAASLLPHSSADIKLTDWVHEWQLKQKPVTARIDSTDVSAVPDLWLDFTILAGSSKKPYRIPVWVEIDMGTEWGKRFKDKLRDIVLLVTSGSYQDHFGVQNATVAFATPGTLKRRDLMRQHIKAVLEELGKVRFADLFLFAALPQEQDPPTMFLSHIWYTPLSDTSVPLLDMSD